MEKNQNVSQKKEEVLELAHMCLNINMEKNTTKDMEENTIENMEEDTTRNMEENTIKEDMEEKTNLKIFSDVKEFKKKIQFNKKTLSIEERYRLLKEAIRLFKAKRRALAKNGKTTRRMCYKIRRENLLALKKARREARRKALLKKKT